MFGGPGIKVIKTNIAYVFLGMKCRTEKFEMCFRRDSGKATSSSAKHNQQKHTQKPLRASALIHKNGNWEKPTPAADTQIFTKPHIMHKQPNHLYVSY